MPNQPDLSDSNLSTLCIHAGEKIDEQGGIFTPLYNHTTFGFSSTQALLDVLEGRKEGNLYTRYGLNPTIRSTEQKLAALEDAEAALSFNSGMAAISAVFLAHCKAGDHIVCLGDIYGGTYEVLAETLPNFGIQTTFILGNDMTRLAEAITDKTRLVYFETPTNPNLDIIDIRAVTQVVDKTNALTVVDNTFASPVNQTPLQLGADLVVHSATKYLGGHSDLTGGVVMGRKALLDNLWVWRKNLGQFMPPEVAFLLTRSLRTLTVRVHKHNENAQAIAEFLASHPRVKKVNYPGLSSHPGHETATRQMNGFGGTLSFVYDGDAGATARMCDRLQLFALAVSLGGVESLVTQPVTTTHHNMTAVERKHRGIDDGLVRLSIGLEDSTDLIADLAQALDT